MSTITTFDSIENNHDVCSHKDSIKKFCESLREHTIKIINSEKKKMIPFRNTEYKSDLNQTNCHICKYKLR